MNRTTLNAIFVALYGILDETFRDEHWNFLHFLINCLHFIVILFRMEGENEEKSARVGV